MDEQTIKVLARFTEVGQLWPMGAWVYLTTLEGPSSWMYVDREGLRKRYRVEISELEANSRGFFRPIEK
jgi:hypothetical protein